MSYIEVINEETFKFIQKSTELILQFRDFDKHTYQNQYGQGAVAQEQNYQKYMNPSNNNNNSNNNNLYDEQFQLINQTFFGFIRKHAQNFQNWTTPEQKELTIEIFGQNKLQIASQQVSNTQNQIFQQNPNSQGAMFQGAGQQSESHKLEEWKFLFRHLNNEEESSNSIQRVMNPQQFLMNLSILTRSLLILLTNTPVFKCRQFLKTSRRVHFTKGTVNEFDLNFQKVPLKLEVFSKRIYLLHHVFEIQVKYLVEQDDLGKMSQESAHFTTNNLKQGNLQLVNQFSQFSIYSHVDSSDQSFVVAQASEVNKPQTQVKKVENQKEQLKQSNVTNQSIFDIDFSSESNFSPRNSYSPPYFPQARQQAPPKKYSEDLTLLAQNKSDVNLIQTNYRDKSNTINQEVIQESEEISQVPRRNTECQGKKDQLQEQLDFLLDKLIQVGDPFQGKKQFQDVLQSLQV
ncbi:hypothetical protein TTHERM_00388330 (macronuclear) [Tetrahymena thermophila SB210]|uniref:Uncharacterized protein n=1 Tax=Tetrahymena thermophila (strain SB210) TaxID=312017 RepID=Q23RF6_TETTS|nr:hypothetical protein TTHERM_00388330 [Tetrahymena thermophila SB210]EAR99092.2 hypothetical protein TTHERM_00388330 [Tetrahymena thermophila SB210]|eukprot:XP_001019337.2 hypothetical protein TTHERM_00388330 [Tetrahymena thermophila SB210]